MAKRRSSADRRAAYIRGFARGLEWADAMFFAVKHNLGDQRYEVYWAIRNECGSDADVAWRAGVRRGAAVREKGWPNLPAADMRALDDQRARYA